MQIIFINAKLHFLVHKKSANVFVRADFFK